MSRRALIIGINYTGTTSALNGCINDAMNMNNFVKTEFKLGDENIRIMTDTATNSALIPTKANILTQMRWLIADAKSDSRLLLHYSGHGTYINDQGTKDENDGRDEAICPIDYSSAGLIIDDELRSALINPLPAGCQLTGIFDCCHSGTIFDLKYNYLYYPSPARKTFELQIEKNSQVCKASVFLISGCIDSQTSADAYIDRKPQGAMTYSFLKAYNGIKDKQKDLNCMRLLKNLYTFVKEGKFTQNPKLSVGSLIPIDAPFSIM